MKTLHTPDTLTAASLAELAAFQGRGPACRYTSRPTDAIRRTSRTRSGSATW